MCLRRAASAFLRRIRLPSMEVTAARRPNSNRLSSSALFHSWKNCSFLHCEGSNWISQDRDILWIFLSGQAAHFILLTSEDPAIFPAALLFGISSCPVFAENVATEVTSENDLGASNVAGLQRIDDGSVVSNEHTSKWRIFTDNGREFFMQGKLDEAEKFFLSAVEEAKEGFGAQDPHVASACNNLAELYRVRRAYDKAEPLYLQAIKILEDSFGPEDVRVGAAFHNLGKFYLMQRKLEQAQACYECALKIKGCVLGHGHSDFADTMYHLGTVLYLQGNEKDAEALIGDSIRILEEGGLGESYITIRRLRYLAQMFLKSNQLEDAENVQRKILHKMDLSKGWNSLDTVIAAESLAMTLQSLGKLRDARDLFERCLDVRRSLLPADHIQVAANMFSLGRLLMLNSNQLRKLGTSEAAAELDRAKDLLRDTIRITQSVLDGRSGQRYNMDNYGLREDNRRDGNTALLILLQSLNALARLEIAKRDFQEAGEESPVFAAESALHKCMSAYRQYGSEKSISAHVEVKAEYLSCLKYLLNLINDATTTKAEQVGRATAQELKDEITHVEAEISQSRRI